MFFERVHKNNNRKRMNKNVLKELSATVNKFDTIGEFRSSPKQREHIELL